MFRLSYLSLALLPSLTPKGNVWNTKEIGGYFLEITTRSSSVREILKEKIREPSVETLLRQVRDFAALAKWSPEEIAAYHKAEESQRVNQCCEKFSEWYVSMRAPSVVNMSEPWTWFPRARQIRRKIVFHAGPTNSGKTHAAIQALMNAKSGVYCAPLKALAAQVWKQVN